MRTARLLDGDVALEIRNETLEVREKNDGDSVRTVWTRLELRVICTKVH